MLNHHFIREIEFKPDGEAQSRGLAATINDNDIGDIFIARQSGAEIAMVNILYTITTALRERLGILEDMVVAPKCRGLAVGSKLLCYTLEVAKRSGCKRIPLLTDANNESARHFYHKHGLSLSSMEVFRISLDD